jgi:hypothetical protein
MNSYYINDKNYLIASQWSGTYVPSSIYSFFFKVIFWMGMFFLKLISWNQHEQSVSLVALKKLMLITRNFQVAELSKIRVPFLGVINQIPYDFSFKLVKVNHVDIFII